MRRLEMLVSAGGEEIGVEEKHAIAEQRFARDRGLVERLQERVAYMRRKGLNLKGVGRVFVRRVGRCRPLQILMHDAMNDLMDDQAPVEVALRQFGVRSALGKRRDVRFVRDK